MQELASKLGSQLKGGEVIELIGDVGAGKTTFMKGLAKGLGVAEDVQSPSFTINRLYDAKDGLVLSHYDFYRLDEPGIMNAEITEATLDPKVVVAVEWAENVADVLPKNRITVTIQAVSETERDITITGIDLGEKL